MRIRKSVAGIAAGTLAIAGLGVLSAPSALAGTTVQDSLSAEPVNNAGVAAYNGNINDADGDGLNTIASGQTASLSAAQVGANVELTITMDVGPNAGFAAVGAGSYQYEFDIVDGTTVVLSGDQCETNAALSPAVAIGGNYAGIGGSSPIPALVCTIPNVSVGAHSYDIRNMNVNGNGSSSGSNFGLRAGFDANVNRDPNPAQSNAAANYVPTTTAANWGVTAALTVVGPELTSPSVTNTGVDDAPAGGDDTAVPGAVVSGTINYRNFDVVGFAGNNLWDPSNNNFRVRLCGPSGIGCAPVAVPVGTFVTAPTVTAGGVLNAASFHVTGATTTGLGSIKLEQCASAPCSGAAGAGATVVKSAFLPTNVMVAPPTFTSPANVTNPGSFGLSGSGWYPGETVTFSTDSTDTPVTGVAAGNSGSVSATIVMSSSAGTAFTASGIDASITNSYSFGLDNCVAATGSVPAAVACETTQNISASVTAGQLRQDVVPFNASGSYTSKSIDFGAVTSSVTGSTVNRNLNPITVTDARGGLADWSLTATMPNLTNGGSGIIENGNMAISGITCAETADAPGSAQGQSAGGNTTFAAGSITLCNGPASNAGYVVSDGDTSGGKWVVNGSLALSVPAFQTAGSYTSTITVLLA